MFKNQTGIAVPLSALRTEQSPVIGEFSSLKVFADFAKKAGLSIIQILPVLDTGSQSSPYSSLSAFALHPMYINLTQTCEFQNCYDKDASFKKAYDTFIQHKNDTRFDYDFVTTTKDFLLRRIFSVLIHSCQTENLKTRGEKFLNFLEEHKSWLPAYCVYKYLKYKFMESSWQQWDKQYKNLSEEQILELWNNKSLKSEVYFYAWEQFIAFTQFKEASDYVKSCGIILKGDLPILLNEDSCDVWSKRKIFNQKFRAGSPPDGDNPTGQDWGFPCYDFAFQEKDNFSWWRKRVKLASYFFTACRLDHIPGFFRLWSIPEKELSSEMGHTEPFSPVTEAQLLKSGFSKERIKWLSQPHIPTEDFIRLIGNPETTREILGTVCDRIGHEELWLFKPSIKSEIDIKKINLDKYNIDVSIQLEIFRRLGEWWKNRTLIEIKKNKFLPLWKYTSTRAWASLSEDEQNTLRALFNNASEQQEKLWKKQAEKIFTAIKSESDMILCGEDLGVSISCMEKVLDKFEILGLKVMRWCRKWEKPEQPFEDFHIMRKLSVITSSVHDSSSLREWYDFELQRILIDISYKYSDIFIDDSRKSELDYFIIEKTDPNFSQKFTPKSAESLLTIYAQANGCFFIPPLQDWLYLDENYYAEDVKSERINIPGTVSKFNWTWCSPVIIEKLIENKNLIAKINKIAKIHDENNLGQVGKF